MPELPEVEVTRRRIAPYLVGRTIARVHTTKPSYFFLTAPATLARRLVGRRITRLDRVGKYLIASLDDGSRVLLHLGMTGQLFTAGATSDRIPRRPDQHTHLRIEFSDRGPEVMFRDARKFGKVRHLAPGKSDPRLDKLGDDALSITGEGLFVATRKRRIPIKSVLLDQSVLAGVGNIYADEALFLAGVRPTRRADRVKKDECERIADAVRRVLARSIEAGGSSISDYVQPDGSDGAYQDERRVYARDGEACLTCGTTIRRVVIGQRSSCFCPACQR